MGRSWTFPLIRLGAACFAALPLGDARAGPDEAPPVVTPDAFRFGGDIEAGVTFNPTAPGAVTNFGHLFTGKADQLVLNRFALFAERAPDPDARRLDLGFRVSGAYGQDSQFTHFQGLGDVGSAGRNSFDLLEAKLQAHLPWAVPSGVDVQAGLFVSPMGAESLDPAANLFYSHSYIFAFALPWKHTGVLAHARLGEGLALFAGYTTGVNATAGPGGGYNDAQPHVLGGLALALPRGELRAFTHIGPEDAPDRLPPGVDPRHALRYINDVTLTWKLGDHLRSLTEFAYVRDDGLRAQAGGILEQLAWRLSPGVTAALRAELWRDAQGAFTAAYPGNLDYLAAEEGRPNGAFRPGPATYGALTLGFDLRLAHVLDRLAGVSDSPFGALTVRPEIRYDRALAGAAPFGGRLGGARDQVTIGVDVVAPLVFQRNADDRGDRARPVAPPPAEADPVRVIDAPARAVPHSGGLADLDGIATGLVMDDAPGPGGLRLAWRGMGDEGAGLAGAPAVNVVVDGIEFGPRLAALVDPFDIAAATAVAGPTGLDGGPAAVGGEVRLSRAPPSRRWGLAVDYGFQQGYHAQADRLRFDAPLGPDAGLALLVAHRQRGGYLTNIATGDPLYGRDELTTGTLQLDWTPVRRLYARLALTLARQDGQGEPASLGDPLAARLFGPALAKVRPDLAFNAYGVPYLPGVTTPVGPWESANQGLDRDHLTARIYSLDLAWNAPIGRLASTTALINQNDGVAMDLGGGCDLPGGAGCLVLANPLVGTLNLDRTSKYNQFSQELRFTRDFAGRARLTTGLYLLHADSAATALTRAGAPAVDTRSLQSETRESRAAFTDLSVALTGRLTVSGGVRWVDERVTYRQSAGPIAVSEVSDARRALSRFAVDYRLGDHVDLQASRASGFRPGGLSPGAAIAAPVATLAVFTPESVVTYEAGGRARLASDRVTLSVRGFLTQDRDRQLAQTALTPGYPAVFETYVVNLPSVEIRGLEVETSCRPAFVPGLALGAGAVVQHGRINDGKVPAGDGGVGVDYTGVAPPRTPSVQLSLSGDYQRRLGPGVADLQLRYRWTDRYALTLFAGQADEQAAFDRLDVSIGYSRSFYRIAVSVRNLLNRAYVADAIPALFLHRWGEPRTAVVELQARF